MNFNGQRAVLASFFVVAALELWKWFKAPDPNSPVPLPPPYVFTGLVIVFGGLSLVGDFFSYKVAGAFAVALTLAIAIAQFQQIQNLKTPTPAAKSAKVA